MTARAAVWSAASEPTPHTWKSSARALRARRLSLLLSGRPPPPMIPHPPAPSGDQRSSAFVAPRGENRPHVLHGDRQRRVFEHVEVIAGQMNHFEVLLRQLPPRLDVVVVAEDVVRLGADPVAFRQEQNQTSRFSERGAHKGAG